MFTECTHFCAQLRAIRTDAFPLYPTADFAKLTLEIFYGMYYSFHIQKTSPLFWMK